MVIRTEHKKERNKSQQLLMNEKTKRQKKKQNFYKKQKGTDRRGGKRHNKLIKYTTYIYLSSFRTKSFSSFCIVRSLNELLPQYFFLFSLLINVNVFGWIKIILESSYVHSSQLAHKDEKLVSHLSNIKRCEATRNINLLMTKTFYLF